MSAFVVGDEHVAMMLRAGLAADRVYGPLRWYWGESLEHHSELTRNTVNEVGAMLFAEIQKSVNHRYSEDDAPPEFRYRDSLAGRAATPVEVLKGIHCFEYQSCETAEWSKSEAQAFCRALESAVVHALPGYDEAPWEWTA